MSLIEQLPLNVSSHHIVQPRVDVYYPTIREHTNKKAETRINQTIKQTVWRMMKDQGYGQKETELTGTYDIKTNQPHILSLTLSIYQFSGGAHGTTLEKGLTFNTETGQLLSFKDLFLTTNNHRSIINERIKSQLNERNLTSDLLVPFSGVNDDTNFYIADQTLVIFFNQYELLPYVYGITYFPIPLYLFPDISLP
ncbi:hypothetical protein DH09_11160 [Bacillaceae bacterium JMAK1]|nr:hypothetical protein DH09_11160 [Bacillaceae bacterium JMAK1]